MNSVMTTLLSRISDTFTFGPAEDIALNSLVLSTIWMQSDAPETIDATTPTGRWRLICPNGHTNWDTTNYHFWCHQCSQLMNIDPEYFQLFDRISGALVSRAQVVIE